ncbi:MAG: glycosyltransferase family 39 protein [Kofleriaceae bacterium]
MSRRVLGVVALAAAGLALAALVRTGALYADFRLPQAGVMTVPIEELGFLVWFALWGSIATACLGAGLWWLGVAARLPALVDALARRRRAAVAVAGSLAVVLALGVRFGALLDEPITDDELTYLFEAQTLLEGRLVNPPPADAAYFGNQFVIMSERAWAGKYPLGHPLVLALGEAVSLRALVVPLLALGSLLLTFAIGRRLVGDRRAALAAILLVASPQFVTTHATQLSQPTELFFLLLSTWALLRLVESRQLGWAVAAGLAGGLAIATRPMPGVPWVLAMVGWALWVWRRDGWPWARRLGAIVAAAPGLVVGVGLILLYNHALTGSVTQSGYEVIHGANADVLGRHGEVANSVGGALLRQNFWLLGWTMSLVVVLLARPRRHAALLWLLVAAVYAYRVLVPKTVVSTTGPIYVFEVVPLLVLATVDGAARLAGWLGAVGVAGARARVMAGALAASVVGVIAFVPPQLRAMHAGAEARAALPQALTAAGVPPRGRVRRHPGGARSRHHLGVLRAEPATRWRRRVSSTCGCRAPRAAWPAPTSCGRRFTDRRLRVRRHRARPFLGELDDAPPPPTMGLGSSRAVAGAP